MQRETPTDPVEHQSRTVSTDDPIGMEAAVKVVLDNHFENVTVNLTETPNR